MAIWGEFLVLSLLSYAIGIGIGWIFWGRQIEELDENSEGTGE